LITDKSDLNKRKIEDMKFEQTQGISKIIANSAEENQLLYLICQTQDKLKKAENNLKFNIIFYQLN